MKMLLLTFVQYYLMQRCCFFDPPFFKWRKAKQQKTCKGNAG
jgi:hypothetical protein